MFETKARKDVIHLNELFDAHQRIYVVFILSKCK